MKISVPPGHIRNYFCWLLLLFANAQNLRSQQTADRNATKETVALYHNLLKYGTTQTLIGHQDDRAYGVGWKRIDGVSDVKLVTGQYPAVYGWDLGHLELGNEKNLDGVSFQDIKKWIKQTYWTGAIQTISWHLRNPMNGESAWDTTHGTVASILPGGAHHDKFKGWLDRLAVFFNDLRDERGKPIPVLFRPFHELTGNWFWWCRNACSAKEFVQLWRFTFSYLQQEKGIHHLLWVFNTASFSEQSEFLERYPGDEWVDVLSFDRYQHGSKPADRTRFISEIGFQLKELNAMARQRKKVAAFAETGLEGIPDSTWWTETLYPLLRNQPVSYVLLWRNHGYMKSTGTMHHYMPYPGHLSANDFKKFSQLPNIGLEKAVRNRKYYQP